MSKWRVSVPLVIAGLCAVYVLSQARPRTIESQFDLESFGRIPVSAGGRVKPMDTVARSSLLVISGKQTVAVKTAREDDGDQTERWPAIRWLAEVIVQSKRAAEAEIFRIDDPDVLGMLGWEQTERKRFSFAELMEHGKTLDEQIARAINTEQSQRSAMQLHLLELSQKLKAYADLVRHEAPYAVPPLAGTIQWQPQSKAEEQAHAQAAALVRSEAAGQGIDIAQMPRAELEERFHRALEQVLAQSNPLALQLHQMQEAYRANRPEVFNKLVADYHAMLDQQVPIHFGYVHFETFFNRFEPFYHSSVLYGVALIIGLLSWLLWGMGASPVLRWSAFGVLVLTLLLQTFGLVARIYIQGRPPVTNLYSSAIFIGWGCVLVALLLEMIFRNGFGNTTAAVLGLSTGIIAHHLALEGDTMQMMQAVLDTNFWLATHVVVITLGYAATYLAGVLAILFIILGVFTPVMSQRNDSATARRLRAAMPGGAKFAMDVASAGPYAGEPLTKTVGKMIYGILCFAVMASFVGTVLGGIWADQSWGRFWGWDPKENGALIIVVWNALILHARWGGLVRERGIAVLAIVGNIVTSWSWFGVNMLGVGLHSYGFMDSAVFWLVAFVLLQLHFIAVGLIPKNLWRSMQNDASAQAQPLPLRLLAYINPAFSCYLGVALLAGLSFVPIRSAEVWFITYLSLGYITSAALLFATTILLLRGSAWWGQTLGNLVAAFVLSNVIFLAWKFNARDLAFLVPGIVYPVTMIILLNLRYDTLGAAPSQVEPAV